MGNEAWRIITNAQCRRVAIPLHLEGDGVFRRLSIKNKGNVVY
ncbi:hypothetical protein [uncultured Nostoc sp.]